MFSLFTLTSFAQVNVSGVVKSDAGELMPGVNIQVKGTTKGTLTDVSGRYTISVPNAQSILVFSFVGMAPQEIAVNGRSLIDVTMAPSATQMDEVVVTALGISREKKSLAYSVGEVKTEDLVKAGNINVMKSLDGKISGVNLTSLSSDPTSSVLVNIRGTTAMPTVSDRDVSKKGQPLYVIDGIPVGRQTFTSKDGVDFGASPSTLLGGDYDSCLAPARATNLVQIERYL